jgi:glycogen(starch) synthase
MRVVHLAWEYPPVMYGGLGRHVHALATAQAANGHDVVVITQAPGNGDDAAGDDGDVRVLRAGGGSIDQRSDALLDHVGRMEGAFVARGEALIGTFQPDVIHAHDWMVSHAGVALRRASGAPLVATIHATEAGRNNGWITTELSTRIHLAERWLARTSDAVITCSAAMRREVEQLFGVPGAHVVANGIDLTHWVAPNGAEQRMRAAHADAWPLLAYTGRVEWEKGVQTILEALPRLRSTYPRVRLVVAGRGSYLPALQAQAEHLGLGDSAQFLGWVSEADLRGLVAAADVAIAPSLYEPFGLVALEAAALGTPVVVADTGGLVEFAAAGERALTFPVADAEGLAAAVRRDLDDPEGARARAARATDALAVHYDWRVIAEATAQVYREARGSLGSGPADPRWTAAQERHAIAHPPMTAPPGHLLDTGR